MVNWRFYFYLNLFLLLERGRRFIGCFLSTLCLLGPGFQLSSGSATGAVRPVMCSCPWEEDA